MIKLAPPRVGAALLRPRLLDRLALGLDATLTTVTAGAGYGKTTLMAQFARTQTNLLWYHLGPEDADGAFFLDQFVSGIRVEWGIFVPRLKALLQEQTQAPRVEALVAALVSDLMDAPPDPRLLVLDDYHELPRASATVRFFQRLLLAAPENVHVFVTSREQPALPVDRLRVRGQLNEIGQEDLAFALEETEALFGQIYGSDLEHVELHRLHHVTAGWATGLYLGHYAREQQVLDWLERGADLAYRFFLHEVLERAAPKERLLLLFASLLPEVSAPEAAALTGDSHARETLERLELTHRFVYRLPGGTYQLHPLFREHLHKELRRRYSPTAIRAAHRRLAELYMVHEQPDRAVPHLLQAGRWQELAGYLAMHFDRLVNTGKWELLRELAGNRPPDGGAPHAWWLLVRGQLTHSLADLEGAAQLCRQALERFRSLGDEVGELAAMRSLSATLMGSRPDEALALLRDLLGRDGARHAAWRANMLGTLAQVLFRTGRRSEGLAVVEETLAIARQNGDAVEEARAYNNLAMYVHTDEADLPRARRALIRAVAAANRAGAPTLRAVLQANLGVVLVQLGEYPLALGLLNETLRLAGELRFAVAEARALEGLGLAHSYQGDFARGEEFLLKAWRVGERIPLRATLVAAGLCNLYRRWGRSGDALRWGTLAAELAPQVNLPHVTASVHAELSLARADGSGPCAAASAPEPGSAAFWLNLLGKLRLELDGAPVPLPPQALLLLGVVSLGGERGVARRELLSLLWPGTSPEAQRNRLRVALHRVRAACPGLLAARGATVALRPGAVRVDAMDFFRQMEAADRLWADDHLEAAAEAYRSALGLYRGDLAELPGADSQRTQLRRRFASAALRLARLGLAGGHAAEATSLCLRILAVDPGREDARRALRRAEEFGQPPSVK